jgi:hypothetical protein
MRAGANHACEARFACPESEGCDHAAWRCISAALTHRVDVWSRVMIGIEQGAAGDAPTPAAAEARRTPAFLAWARTHQAIVAVFAIFALAALIVPTLTPVAITDDWVYARSAQILLQEGRLTIFPISVASAIGQIAWGALFGLLLGPSLGVFRLSTVVLTGLGALALYALCRDLGVPRERSALGVAAYLFNPLVFILAFTFMTDPHFAALLVMATWCFSRCLTAEGIDRRFLIAGSGLAALGFLTRQQGALIPLAFLAFLLVTRRLHVDRASVVLVARVIALPAMVMVGYYLWLHASGGAGAMQAGFAREVLERGTWGTWWLLRWLTVFVLIYAGFFTLPIVAAALPQMQQATAAVSRRGWILFALLGMAVTVGVGALALRDVFMPYIPQFVGPSGLGPPDLLGGRPILLGQAARVVLTVACLIASLVLALIAARAVAAPESVERSRAGLVLSILLWQFAGVFPPSYHFLGWSAGSVDRYLLPLAPLTIALALWGTRGMTLTLPAGWVVVAALALFAIAGTRDYLVFMGNVWSMAEEAVAEGVPLDRLDAGASWDGYHLYEYGVAHNLRPRTPRGRPWWTDLFAPATDSAYVVSGAPLPGHEIVAERSYSSWLQREPTSIYLEVRQGEPWPPG